MDHLQAKKGVMYLTGEDFYYFTYSIILILEHLNCKNGKYFTDYRKLAFLIDFVNDRNLISILQSTKNRAILNTLDKEYLFRSYSNGLTRRSEILKLIFTLEDSGYLELIRGDLESVVNISLNTEALPSNFIDSNLFTQEYENLKSLCQIIKRLSVLTLETMIKKIYEEQGVKTWAL